MTLAKPKKGEMPIKIKTIRVEGEITAYGSKSILHRKLTCYEGSKGVAYFADDRFKCSKDTLSVVWRAFKKLPKFAHAESETTLPLQKVVDVFEKRLRPDTKSITDYRQKKMAEDYNKEIKEVVKELKKLV